MRKSFVVTFLLIFTGGIFLNSCVRKIPDEIVWNDSFDHGRELAQSEGKNLLVEFDKDG